MEKCCENNHWLPKDSSAQIDLSTSKHKALAQAVAKAVAILFVTHTHTHTHTSNLNPLPQFPFFRLYLSYTYHTLIPGSYTKYCIDLPRKVRETRIA